MIHEVVRETVQFNKSGINQLPDDKPVVYRIQTQDGKTNYVGVAHRGRVRERVADHLAGARDAVPGSKVRIDQAERIGRARQTEARAISRSKPKYNKQGK